MCDCFHLVLPNWQGSPASASGRQLRPEDTEADGEADAEDDSISEVTTESIRPRPQGSSPVYEYCIEDEYFNKKLQQDIENRQRRDSTFKMSDSQESMEVTLQTEVESGASGFSVAGGGAEGIFVKQVLKESPASNLFSLREGDQLLSATIFFDNIKYEDALKILQYSEPYKVQFNLKRKFVGKDELEAIHSATQSKKEKLSQGMDTMEISEKTISEEDKANLIVKQRVGRPKRTKKDRLSWPKFQSIKGKKILGHRRSRSTSDAYEHGIPDVSPTSTDTESQFQPEEIHGKIKKQSQKKLKFPTIGFKMHKSKLEPYEINPFKEYENDTAVELSEIMTKKYTSLDVDRKPKEKESKRGVSDAVFPLPQHTKKYPDVELTITKSKEKKLKSNIEFTKQEPTVATTQMKTAVIQTKDITDSQIKVSQNIPKTRKKKQKDSKVQIETQYQKEEKGKETNIVSKYALPQTEAPKVEMDIKMPKMDLPLPKAELKMGEITADINISEFDIKSTARQGILELKTTNQETNITSDKIPADGSAITLEDDETRFKMLKLQMPRFGLSLPKRKGIPEGELSISSMEADFPKTGLKTELKTAEIEADIILTEVEIEAPSLDVEIGDKGKIKMPILKMPSVKVAKLKAPEVGISMPKVEADITLPKGKAEMSDGSAAIKLPEAESTIDGQGLKIHMPKFKMPSMGFSKPDIKGPKIDVDVSMPKVDISLPEAEIHVEKSEVKGEDITISAPEVKIPTGLASLELKAPEVDLEAPSGKVSVQGPDLIKHESGDKKFQMPKFHMPKFGMSLPKGKGIPEAEISVPSVEAELPKTKLKTEVTLPSAELQTDLKLPQVEVDAPSLDMEIGDKGKIKMPEVKMPSVKVPKLKGPEVGISLPKVEAHVTLPKGKVEVSDGAASVKLPEAEGTIDGGGLKIQKPKFKMPSMGFSKPDIKGPKMDVDVSIPKIDLSLPKADLQVGKPEMTGGDISISAPEVKTPMGQGSLEPKPTDVEIETLSRKVAVQGPDVKLESGDSTFKMPWFQMPQFGTSLYKGKSTEVEITVPSIEAIVPKSGLEVTMPSAELEADIKLPKMEAQTHSLEMEVGEKSKIKMPLALQHPEITLERGESTFKIPKFHMPKFGISVPQQKVVPEEEVAVASVEVDHTKTELKREVTLPSLGLQTDIKVPDVEVMDPSVDIEVGDEGKIKMPGLKMPSIKVPKLKGPEVGISLSKVEADVSLLKGKAEVSDGAASIILPEAEGTIEGGGLKIHMPHFKMPSMRFSKPDIKGPKVDVDVSMPKMDISLSEAELQATKQKLQVGKPTGDVMISAPDMKIPMGQTSMEIKPIDFEIEVPSSKMAVKEPKVEMESRDSKFKMAKFQMPKFGISLPKGKGLPEADMSIPSVEPDLHKTGLKAEITLPSAEREVVVPSLDIDVGDKDKIKIPGVKLSSIKAPKLEAPEVGISIPKVETDISVTKRKIKGSHGAATIKLPETESTIEGGGMKIHMPKFKMPSMGFSKPDIKEPKVDVDVSMPNVDVSLPEAELHAYKPDIKADITISAPGVKIPMVPGREEFKAPDVDRDTTSREVFMEGPDLIFEKEDTTFKISKFRMPKFGMSLPKGKGVPEAEISVPSVEAELPKTELKAEVTLPSAELQTDLKLPQVEVDAPSLDVEFGDKGKIKMPEVKMPSVKVPKLKGPEVGISLPKVEAHVTLPKGKVEVSDGAASVKLPEAEGTIEGVGLKIQKPKFMKPSMGFSKPDIKGPKIDVDVTMPKVDVSLPKAELHVEKPEVKGGDITISAPDVKIQTGSASLELKAPEVDVEAPSGKVSVQGPDVKLESGDRKFHMPKFHMPKFGMSLPKGKGVPEAEISVPSVEAELPKTALKAEVTLPSAELQTDLKLPQVEVDAPSLDVEFGDKGKIKMPEVKMPSVKVPKLKGPEVGISLPKVETDVTLPKGKDEVSDGAAAVKSPEAEDTIEGGGLKIQKPKFKMPSMGFSKPDIKGPKMDVDVTMPKVDVSLPKAELHVEKPEVKGGDITISASDVKIPTGSASLELKAPEVDVEAPSGKFSVQGPDVKLESGDRKFQMPKFHMPKFGMSLPKGKGVPEAEISVPSVEAELPKTELKAEVTLPSAELQTDLKLPQVEVDAPSLDVEFGDKGKIKMPEVKMPSVKVPKLKRPEVGISLPKVEAHVTLPKGKVEVSDGAASVKLPEAEGTIEGVGLKIQKPKFKKPSMGFSKPDIKGPKMDVDVTMPKVDVSLPKAELHVEKPEVKGGDITISAPDVKIQTGSASLELKAPEVDVEAPSGKVSVQGPDVKLESGDRKFHMPKFHMPKFGMSLPKGKGVPEAEISVPSVEAELPKTELKAEVTLSSAELQTDLKLPQVEVDAPSLDVEIGDKGKIKMPEVKMPSVKVPKLKGPEVGISLPKVETDVTLPKGKVEVSDGAAAVKSPEAEGTIDGGGLKIQKPKFKMPSMGFSKPDIKGPKMDVDVTMPKVDVSLPKAELHVEKPEVKGGDITISASDVKIPTGSASLELKAPEVDVEAPSGKFSVQGPDVKLESGDRKFQMPKFHMPKFGMSLPKGKGVPEAEISVPSVEAELPKTELKAEVTLPSAELQTDLKLPQVEVDAPSLDVEFGDKGKIKMPEVKMPSVKVPKLKRPEVGITLPKVEAHVTLPKGKVEVSDGAASVKLPEAEGTIEGVGLKIQKPKFKKPSMGFSKPDIKGPKMDVDVTMPKVDVSLPKAELHVEKPEVKGGDITISAPDVKIPTGSASLELKAPEVDVEAPSGKFSVQGPDVKLESGDRKFQMPKFHMPKFGMSLPKGKGVPEAEISVPSVEAELPKTELKAEVTLRSAELQTDIKLPQVEVDAPSLDVEIGDKGKIKMPEVKMPSVKVPKLKGPEVGISLPKVETDVTLPKGKVEVSDGAAAVKSPEAEGTIDGGGLKIQKPKFKMPIMGFSKPDIKDPKMDVDVTMPKVDVSLPKAELHVEKPEVKGGDITISASDVKIPTGSASLELKAPEVDVEAPSGKFSVQGPDVKLESGDRKFQMPKFHMPKFGMSLPKGKGVPEAEISVPSVEAELPKTELKAEVTLPSAELQTDLKLPQVEVDAPSLDVEIGDKGKIKMPEVKMPSVKVPKLKRPEVGISLPKVETHVTLPKGKVEVSDGAASVKSPEAEGTIEGVGLKIQKPKFKKPSMGFSKPDIKGPKMDVDVTMPKVDVSLPKAELHVEKPEVNGGDITISAPDVKIPTGSASLELKAPDVDVETPSGKVSVQGPDVKLESGDRKFHMPKFHMPKFGMSLPKGKGIPEAEISVPSVEAELPKTELKAEVTLPSAELQTDLKLPQVEVDAPSLDVEIGDKGKIKMPEVKMPSVKVPKLKGPEVGISLPKVETDFTLPKGKVEVSDGAAAVKSPEAEGTIDGGGLKIQKPKFKMPSMGFSKPDIKGPKMDVDVTMPKVDVSLPKAELHVEKPEVKGGDITISAPDVKIPMGSASLELKAPEVDVEAPSGKVSLQGPDVNLESGDRKFHMPKFHMPKFGMSLPKGKGVPEAEISVPSVEAELPKTELKTEVTLPSAELQTDLKLPQVEVDAPSLDVEFGDKGKIKMPELKMPSVKVPKLKGPEVGISLPKVEAHVTLPKGKVEVSDGAASVKLPEAEGTIEGVGLKIQKPKFKKPSMGFSKPDIKGPKMDVDVSFPKAELQVEKPEVKGGDITISAQDVKIPMGSASLELKAPDVDVEAPSGKVSVQGPNVKLESGDRKFHMPKFHMPKFGMSLPKGKGIPEAEISVPSVEAELPKTELKAEVTLPPAELQTDLKLPQVEVDAPSMDVEFGDKGKIKMPEVKMPSVKVPKLKGPEVGISLPKVETDVILPKGKVEVSVGAAAVKSPEAEGTIDGGGLKIHMPKFKMPSMGFSKPDIKGPKMDVDVTMPKVDVSLPKAELHVEKPEVKRGDITISAPDVKIPTGSASLELKAPEVDVEAPSGKFSVQGPDVKLESGDRKFQMPKFHMPKFGMSLPKGKGIPEAEISVPSVEAELPKTELKAEVTLPSAELQTDLKLPQVEVDAPSLDVEIGDKGKIKMPEVKMPSVKVPKLKGPEVGISLPKVETDFTLPKGKVEVSDGAAAVKSPEAEGTIDGGGLKIQKPKFKMPSMGFSKPDIKGPKMDVDVTMPKVDVSLPKAELHVEKPEVKRGDITISAPDVKIPMGSASLELKAPEVDVEAPSGKVSLQGPDVNLESGDRKFHMPKFHMPKFGMSLPKGKGVPEAEISVPSVEAELPKTELKTEVTLPSAELQTDLKLPQVEVDAPSLDVEFGDKGKIKMPEVKMPSVKVPKLKGPEVGISLPKVEAHVTLPKGKVEVSDGAASVKLPEAEGTIEGVGLKIQKPKFKKPSMRFSKPDIKGPKMDVDVSFPKAELQVEKPEVKGGDITISAQDVKIPTGSASLELKAPDVDVEAPSGKVSVQGPDVKLESGDRKFHMPKFHMPKFGMSLPKGKGIPEAEISVPSVEAELPKTELKAEVTLPSAELQTDLKLPQVEVDAPSLDVEIGDKGKIKMPEVKMPSVKVPKLKGPEVGISLPKVETDVTLPKGKVEVSDGAAAVKSPEAEGTIDGGGLKIHMPKFKMPSMGFSKPDIKGPKMDVDVTMPKVDVSLPKAELHVEKPEGKGGDITISAPDVKIPTGSASLELKAPEVDVEAPSGKFSVQGPDVKLESGDRKFQMPKFHMPKFGMSLPKGKGVPEAEISVPSVDAELPKTELKAEVTLPPAELQTDLKLPQVEVDAPSMDVEFGDKGKIKMPEVKMPSVKVPKLKGPEVGISLPKVETDVILPKGKVEVSVGAAAVKSPEAEGTIDGGGLKIHMPKFKMPSMGFSKPDIKGPKMDVDVTMPKVDVSLPKAELHVEKPEVKRGDITISAPDVKIPTGSASLELKAPEVDVEAPSGKFSVQGPDVKLESGDRKFQMPKFHMPKFGMSLPKGKGIPEAEISVPSVEAELPKTELKAEVTLPSAELQTDLKLPQVEVDAPSLDVEFGDKGKIKMPEVKMPSVKVPKLKGPEVGISLPKVETDVTLPKGKVEVSDGAAAVKLPEAEATIEGVGLKIQKPKFKMPSMGFSKPDIKGPKMDVDVSMPKVDVSLPKADLSAEMKPELKWDKPIGGIDMSVPKTIIPTGQGSLEVRSPHPEIEPPSSVAVQMPDVQLESGDSKFKMPKFQMPKVGISRPKAKGFSEGEVTMPSLEGDLPETGLKMEITLPSSELEADINLSEIGREAPSLDVEVEEKGKIKTLGVKLPSVKPPKLKGPEVGISLPKVETDVFLPKGHNELADSEAASKLAEAENSREKGRMKIHMPKFKMPSMGFSKSDIKGPKIDSDVSMPDVHTSLPKIELSTTKPQLKTDKFKDDTRIAAPEVKIPWVPVTVELQSPDVEVQASSGELPDIAIGLSKDIDVPQLKTTMDIIDIAVEAPTLEMESDVLGEKKDVLKQKIKMPQIIRADVKTAAVGIPSVDISVTQSEVSTQDLHDATKEPEAKGQITKRGSLDGEEKGHFKMPKFKLPSLSWSPKKEASLKTNVKETLEESHLGIVSDDTGTEPKVTISEDQGVPTDGNVDIATKKGQVKRPHLMMPKISLSKTKLPKAEVDIVMEGDGALVQIPDIENSFTTSKIEETEISVKMLKGEIKEIKEIQTFQTDTDISLPKTDIKVSMTKSSFEQKCLETEFKGDICMDSASMKSDGTEGEFRMPKLKMPKFGVSDLSESKISDLSGSGITVSIPESDASQFQMTTESDEFGEKAQPLQVKSDEGISEEMHTEESQSWFKMPKFKMPSFGRTSKAKKSEAETEDITGEAHVTELQVEVKSPEVVTISRELDSGKKISEQKVMLPQEDVRAQKEQQSTTDQLVGEGSFLQSSEKVGRKPRDLEPKTYADIVKDGAEGQISQTEFIGTIPKMDIDSNIPKSEVTIQQPEVIPDTMAVAEIPSTDITMGKKIDATITDPEPLQSLDTQPEELGTEKKSPKKDSQGKESIFKMPTFSVPLFGWSTTKSSAIVPGIESDLEEPAVTLSKVKMDVSITDEDFEIIDFPVEGFEKDLPKEGEVKAEEKEKTSKTKAPKFKIPKFANLRSKSQGVEIQVDSPKVQTEPGSLVRLEGETSGIQVQDKKPGDAEESFQMPKFKMLKFTHRISEGDKLTSEETMDIKDAADDDISQLQFKTMFPEEKGDDIQKSKVRITTLSEPAIQRPQVGSKFQSTDSSFVDTTVYVHKQVPKEFSAEFLKETIETMDSNIQKSIAKITTLKEPDIQRAPLEIKLQPDDPFSSSAPVQVKGSITESKEIKMESKSTFGCGDVAKIQESFSTQIVKESEIPPSEVKSTAFGFSLLKVKIQESHVNLDVPVKLSSTKCMGEIFEDKDHQLSGTGEAAQKAGLSEVKSFDKDKDITYEYIEGTSSAATLTTLKSFTVDIQSSSEFAESHSESIEIAKSAIETAEETSFTSSTDEVTDEKDSKRSGRFKLWFPSIGFSPSTDDTTSDSKPEAQPKPQPDDSSKLDSDTAKETEKTGWFKFPKLGFSSPTKKSKEGGKEKETDSKEGKGEESPTDKTETFFDAQETLSLKEKEENETSGDIPSEPIVSSSARTELILLEKGKAEPKRTPEDSSK